ncbi:MAG: right-handed parallel beta-helix repeat-containing protein [Myxococcota bacterium]
MEKPRASSQPFISDSGIGGMGRIRGVSRKTWLCLAIACGTAGCKPPGLAGAGSGRGAVTVTIHVNAVSKARFPDGKTWKTAFPTLAQALQAAPDNAEIWLAPGTYRARAGKLAVGEIHHRKDLRIIGGISPDSTGAETIKPSVLDGKRGTGRVLHVLDVRDSTGISIHHVTVTGGRAGQSADDKDAGNWGGGIFVQDSQVKLQEVTCERNEGHLGGCLGVHGQSRVEVLDSTFRDNQAKKSEDLDKGLVGGDGDIAAIWPWGLGGAVAVEEDGTLSVRGSAFIDNIASAVGGAVYGNRCDLHFAEGTTFTGNRVGEGDKVGEGGAVAASHVRLTLRQATFTGNQAARGGALHATMSSTVRVEKCGFRGNKARGDGGAVHLETSSGLFIADAVFTDNTATQNAGVLHITGDSSVAVSSSRFTGNKAGAGICAVALVRASRWREGEGNTYADNASSGDPMGDDSPCRPVTAAP